MAQRLKSTWEREAHLGARRKCQQTHQRDVKEQGHPPPTHPPPLLWKCVSWREVRNGWAALISTKAAASQGQGEQDEREKGEGQGPTEVGSVEGGGPHLVKRHAPLESGWNTRTTIPSWREEDSDRAAHPVLALTPIITDVLYSRPTLN